MVYVNVYGLGWKVEEDGTVTLPGYSGTVDLHYASPWSTAGPRGREPVERTAAGGLVRCEWSQDDQ